MGIVPAKEPKCCPRHIASLECENTVDLGQMNEELLSSLLYSGRQKMAPSLRKGSFSSYTWKKHRRSTDMTFADSKRGFLKSVQ